METNLVRVPFDVALAKKIQAGEVGGKIVTRDGRPAKIVYFSNVETNSYNVLYVVNAGEDGECSYWAERNGSSEEETADLFLEIPEYMSFNDGDIVVGSAGPFIYNGRIHQGSRYFGAYCGLLSGGDVIINDESNDTWSNCIKRKATESETKKLIDALKASKDSRAKEYLKRFFGIEVNENYSNVSKIGIVCEFKPKDWILCRCGKYEWTLCQFSHIHKGTKQYVAVNGLSWDIAIPYNEKTAHLLGTTDNE